jgi:hypothetical protein
VVLQLILHTGAGSVRYNKDKKTEHAGLHDTIIELKIWAKAQTLGIPGYFIELLCIKEFDACAGETRLTQPQ